MTPLDACKQAIDMVKTALDAGWLQDADPETLANEVTTAFVHFMERLAQHEDELSESGYSIM